MTQPSPLPSPSPVPEPLAPPWLAELLLDVERARAGADAGVTVAQGLADPARADELAGVDLVHGLALALLARGASAQFADLALALPPAAAPPAAAIAGTVRALAGHGIALREVGVDVRARCTAVAVTLAGSSVATLRAPAIGDRIVALGGRGLCADEGAWIERAGAGAGAAPQRSARRSHCSVLHHPLRKGWCAAIAPVHGDLRSSLLRALPADVDAVLEGSMPAAPAHRALLGENASLATAVSDCSCGIGAFVFAPERAEEIAAHVRLWNEPVALLGHLRRGAGRVIVGGLRWAD